MVKFFKLIERNSAEIKSQKGARTHQLQASSKAGRLACTNVHRAARSTTRLTEAGEQSTARSTDWNAEVSVVLGRPTGQPSGWVGRPPGRSTGVSGRDLHLLSGFGPRFRIGVKSNWVS